MVAALEILYFAADLETAWGRHLQFRVLLETETHLLRTGAEEVHAIGTSISLDRCSAIMYHNPVRTGEDASDGTEKVSSSSNSSDVVNLVSASCRSVSEGMPEAVDLTSNKLAACFQSPL